MLTTGNSASPEVGSKYCDAQVAAGAEDYYLGRDESPVQWRGSGASAHDLTLGARVERKQSWRWCAANAPAALNGKAGPGEVLKKRALAQEGKQCRSLTRMRNSGSGPVWSSQSFAHACGGERSLRGGLPAGPDGRRNRARRRTRETQSQPTTPAKGVSLQEVAIVNEQ